MEYFLNIAVLAGIYVLLAASLNLIAGYAGLLSIAHAAFFGVGAYVAALLALNFHSPFWANMICAVLLSGMLGALLGWPSLRIRDDHFVIATFAFQVVSFSILNNWVSLTGGPMGLPGIPQPSILGLSITSHGGFLGLVLFCSLVGLWLINRIVRSPVGRILKAIREDEAFAQSVGKDVEANKVMVFVVGAALASVAGVLYAYYISFVDPTSFTVMESIFLISMVIIGGAGSQRGPVIGAIVLVALPEMLKFVGLPNGTAANLRQILYGSLLVACMLWRPQGLLGDYALQKEGGAD